MAVKPPFKMDEMPRPYVHESGEVMDGTVCRLDIAGGTLRVKLLPGKRKKDAYYYLFAVEMPNVETFHGKMVSPDGRGFGYHNAFLVILGSLISTATAYEQYEVVRLYPEEILGWALENVQTLRDLFLRLEDSEKFF